jgi:hypothetical protein
MRAPFDENTADLFLIGSRKLLFVSQVLQVASTTGIHAEKCANKFVFTVEKGNFAERFRVEKCGLLIKFFCKICIEIALNN